MEDANDLSNLDPQALIRALAAKKRLAAAKIAQGKAIQRQGMEMERQGAADLADVEAFERVLKSLPANDEELATWERAAATQNAFVTMHPAYSGKETALRAFLSGTAGSVAMNSALRSQRDQVIFHCTQLLAGGVWRTTEELLENLLGRGVQLTAANPLQRVSQILSSASQFKNQRGKGWALDTSPGGESSPDEVNEEQQNVATRGEDSRLKWEEELKPADFRQFIDSQR